MPDIPCRHAFAAQWDWKNSVYILLVTMYGYGLNVKDWIHAKA